MSMSKGRLCSVFLELFFRIKKKKKNAIEKLFKTEFSFALLKSE